MEPYMVATCYHPLLLTVTCVTQCLNHHIFCPSVNNSTNGQHMKIHWSSIGISYLAQEVTVTFVKSNHMSLKSKKLLLKFCWQGLAKWSLLWRHNSCSSVSHTHTHVPVLVLKWCCVMWFSMFLWFILHCLTCNWHSSLYLLDHKVINSML